MTIAAAPVNLRDPLGGTSLSCPRFHLAERIAPAAVEGTRLGYGPGQSGSSVSLILRATLSPGAAHPNAGIKAAHSGSAPYTH
jgi:hypothetical protein